MNTRCPIYLLTVALAVTAAACAGEPPSTSRPAYCAGSWYPADADDLSKTVDGLVARASPPTIEGRPIAVIAPHAGYRFSAPVAAAGYSCLRGHSYKRVIVLALSHRYAGSYHGVEVPGQYTAYATPLGEVPIDRAVCDDLLAKEPFLSKPGLDRNEHSLELQLPFLQKVLGEFRLVPLLVGQMTEAEYADAAQAILSWMDDETLLVASSDFTHYGRRFDYTPFRNDVPAKLRELADQAADPITRCDLDGFLEHLAKTNDTICGRNPIALLLRICAMQEGEVQGVRAAFDTSGNLTGDWKNSVTYQSFVFAPRSGTPEAQEQQPVSAPRSVTLGDQEQQLLLRLARQTVTARLKDQSPPKVDPAQLSAILKENGACFVTLENRGRLRGCIGHLVAHEPLYKNVIHNAKAACRDRRFVNNPVTARELDQLHIEISYLTPMKKMEDPANIVVSRHGLMIVMGPNRGVLLPQVASRYGWTPEEFLSQTCLKAGLPVDAWKRPDAELYCFEAEVFGEPQ